MSDSTSSSPDEITRMRALILLLEEGTELGIVARRLKLKPSVILNWKREYLAKLAAGEISTNYFEPFREEVSKLEKEESEQDALKQAEESTLGGKVDLRPRHSGADRLSPDGFLFEPVQNLSPEEREQRLAKTRKKNVLQEADRNIVNEGKAARDVAKDMGISPASIEEWEDKYGDFSQMPTPAAPESEDTEPEAEPTESEEFYTLPDSGDSSSETVESDHDGSEDSGEQELIEEAPEPKIISPLRMAMMDHPLTKWMFKNEDGDFALGLFAGLAITLIGGFYVIRASIGETTNVDAPLARGGLGVNTAVTPANLDLVTQAQAAAEGFIRAEGLEEKLLYVRNPEVMRPVMQKWYATNDSGGWLGRISYKGGLAAGFKEGSFVMLKMFKEPEHKLIPVVVEHTDVGFKIDWATTVGYQPMELKHYQTARPPGILSFRFIVSQSDYYNRDFDDPETWHSFKFSYPGRSVNLYGYVRRDNDLGAELQTMLEFKKTVSLILDIRYPENSSGSDQVEIVDIIQENWVLDYSSEAAASFKR